ncbi:MAG: hypothetical protein AAF518_22655, partial [Spirochaetota bacterium]
MAMIHICGSDNSCFKREFKRIDDENKGKVAADLALMSVVAGVEAGTAAGIKAGAGATTGHIVVQASRNPSLTNSLLKLGTKLWNTGEKLVSAVGDGVRYVYRQGSARGYDKAKSLFSTILRSLVPNFNKEFVKEGFLLACT